MPHQHLHLIQLQKALVPVSKMVIKFGLQCHEFKANIQTAYIQAAEELLKEEHVAVTNQAIAVKTGIDRRKVAEYQQQKSQNKKSYNKMDLVIFALQKCKSNGQLSLTGSQLSQIIDGIYGQHIRAKAVITELLNSQMVLAENNRYKITATLHQKLSMQAELADEVDVTTQRLFETFYKEMFGEAVSELNQKTIQSSRIPPRRQLLVQQLIHDQLIDFQNKMKHLLAEHEVNIAPGTYANIGFSQFQFNDGN